MPTIASPIARLFAEVKRHHRNLFPAHTWQYQSDEGRVCRVCDRQEYFDFGGGAAGSEWTMLQPGRRAAHRIPGPTSAIVTPSWVIAEELAPATTT
jgi:hypothetical protein